MISGVLHSKDQVYVGILNNFCTRNRFNCKKVLYRVTLVTVWHFQSVKTPLHQ